MHSYLIIIIIIVGFIEHKSDTNPPMHLNQRRESPGTEHGSTFKKVPARFYLRWGGGYASLNK